MDEKESQKIKDEIEFLRAVLKMNGVANLDALYEDWKKKTGYFAPRNL